MQTRFVRFFDPSRLKRSFFFQKVHYSRPEPPATDGNRRTLRPLGCRLKAPETSIFVTHLAESTEKYVRKYKYARLSSFFVARDT